MVFRKLNAEEEATFRKWARENWYPGKGISGLWHPVVRDEIAKMEKEADTAPPFGKEE